MRIDGRPVAWFGMDIGVGGEVISQAQRGQCIKRKGSVEMNLIMDLQECRLFGT